MTGEETRSHQGQTILYQQNILYKRRLLIS